MSKKTRLRDCPAAGRKIEAFECASGRHTTFACPEACPFNPFAAANYGSFPELEQAADRKLFEWTLAHAPNRAEFDAQLSRVAGDSPNSDYFHFFAWHAIYRTDPSGDTIIGQWARAGFPGLNHDGRILMQGKARMYPAIVEAHRILDGKRVECVDLLDPARTPFMIVDRGFAIQALRFAVYTVDVIPLPHYARLFGACIHVPALDPFDAEKVVREVISHLGGPPDEAGTRRWLAEHYARFEGALSATGSARRRAMFDSRKGPTKGSTRKGRAAPHAAHAQGADQRARSRHASSRLTHFRLASFSGPHQNPAKLTAYGLPGKATPRYLQTIPDLRRNPPRRNP